MSGIHFLESEGRGPLHADQKLEEESQYVVDPDQISPRTSLTLSDSWDALYTVAPETGGVDVPAFLQPLLGVDYLPFSQPNIEEENDDEKNLVEGITEIQVPPMVEIAAPASPPVDTDNNSSVKSCQRVLSPAPKPEETQELQDLLAQSNEKKKKPGQRLRATVKAVFQRRKSAPTFKRKSSSKRKENPLGVDTITVALEHPTWISPSATAETVSPISCISTPEQVDEAAALRKKAKEQERTVQATNSEITNLQSQLEATISRYEAQLEELEAIQQQLALRTTTATTTAEPAKEEQRVFKRSESGTYIRVTDLDLNSKSSEDNESMSSLSLSAHKQLEVTAPEFLLMDNHLLDIIQQLFDLGFALATDESERFSPTRETAKLIAKAPAISLNEWPIDPWTPAWNNNILVWTGLVSHKGFGHTWPVVKGRAILQTSAKHVLEYLWDSTLVPKYNPLCQGRDDLYTLQDDVHVTAEESAYGFAGCAKVVRSLNKHWLVPKAIEMKSLLYARPLEQHKGSYVLVSRSVWENDTATLDSKAAKAVIRTEMLLGCTIMRAIDDNTCEMTQLTHVHSPGVPKNLAEMKSPGQCHSLIKALQSLFPVPK